MNKRCSPDSEKTEDFTDLKEVDFNVCLAEDGKYRLRNIEQLAEDLLPMSAPDSKHWIIAARELFVGIVVYLFDSDGPPIRMRDVFLELNTPLKSSEHFLCLIDMYRGELSPNGHLFLTRFCNLPEKQSDGVKATLLAAIRC